MSDILEALATKASQAEAGEILALFCITVHKGPELTATILVDRSLTRTQSDAAQAHLHALVEILQEVYK